MTAFEDFLNTEMPQRPVLLNDANTGGVTGDPNLSVEPKVQLAPKGTVYQDAASGRVWQKAAQAVATSWIAISDETALNPKAFGAKGDGITDDTQAIKNCAAAASLAGLGIRFSPGSYTFAANVVDTTFTTIGTVRFDKGATLTVTGAGSLSWTATIEAGNYQIFSAASGKILFDPDSLTRQYSIFDSEVNPQWWGANPSASGAVNSAAIQASFAALPKYQARWRLPVGTYTTDAMVSVGNLLNENVPMRYAVITFDGILYNTTTDVLHLLGMQYCEINNISVIMSTGAYGGEAGSNWIADMKGVYIKGNFWCNRVSVRHIHGGAYGLYMYGNPSTGEGSTLDGGSISYSQVSITRIKNCRKAIYIYGTGDGWCNEMTWSGGSVAVSTFVPGWPADSWGVYFGPCPGHPYSAHRFEGISFELLYGACYFGDALCQGFGIYSCRHESCTIDVDAHMAHSLTWISDSGFDTTKVITGGNTRGFVALDSYNYAYPQINKNILLVGGTAGITFREFGDFQESRSHLSVDNPNGGLMYESNQGTFQRFDKQFFGSAIPTTGSYIAGAICWNSSTAVDAVMGWVCTALGTMGTLVGVTGSTVRGSAYLTVNSATNLRVGQAIGMLCDEGEEGGPYSLWKHIIVEVNGNTLRLNTGSYATGNDNPVYFMAASWKALPRYPGPTDGTGAPASTPTFVGQEYRDTSTTPRILYKATGIASAADWVRVTTPAPSTGAGSPSGVVTPRFIGDDYFDTAGAIWYKAKGLTNTDWVTT